MAGNSFVGILVFAVSNSVVKNDQGVIPLYSAR